MSAQKQTITTKAMVMADDSLRCLVVDDTPLNLTMALGFLLPHNIKAETAGSGEEALRMIIEKAASGLAYDLVFMDHLMPKMDGIETTRGIREWEKSTGRDAETPIIALSANTAAGIGDVFLRAGMNDFLLKPIASEELNRVLGEWLPAGKIRFEEVRITDSDERRTAGLLEELSQIKGLDVNAGLLNFGQRRDGYFLALRQFSQNCDSYIEDLCNAVKEKTWEDYSIKAHALKGVFAAFGVERLSQWAANLEMASKNGGSFSPDICQEETTPFCAALTKFRDMLRATSLLDSIDNKNCEKPKGEVIFLKEQLDDLQKACMECSSEDIEKIMAVLFNYEWDSEIDIKLEKLRVLTSSYSFEEALNMIELIGRSQVQ